MSNKIKVSSLEIIVTEGPDNPYYQIKYYDVVAKSWHIGYSSYDLKNVIQWKEEYFEIVGDDYENYCPHCGTLVKDKEDRILLSECKDTEIAKLKLKIKIAENYLNGYIPETIDKSVRGIISKVEYVCDMIESKECECTQLSKELDNLKQLSNHECDVYSIYPLTVIKDRYNGVYSGGKYTAWNLSYYEIPEDVSGDDLDCPEFWEYNDIPCGKGNSSENAILDLYLKLQRDRKITDNPTCPNCECDVVSSGNAIYCSHCGSKLE